MFDLVQPLAAWQLIGLVGRHGAMNPAGKVRCNMGTKYGWLTTIAIFTGSKPGFCYPRLGHDALRLRPGKPRPAGKSKPSAGRGTYSIRALPDLDLGIVSERLEAHSL